MAADLSSIARTYHVSSSPPAWDATRPDGPAKSSAPVDPWIYRILALGLVGTFVLVSMALTALTIMLAMREKPDALNQILPMVGALGTSVLGILAALLAPSPLQPPSGS